MVDYYKDYEGKRWMLVFYHHVETANDLFTNDWNSFLNINERKKYSILGSIDSRFKYKNQYEFLLIYPEIEGKNIWTQRINPINTIVSGDNGYKPIDISWDTDFLGLSLSSRETAFLDGTRDNSYYYAIGSKTIWCEGIPGPLWVINNICPRTLHKVALYIRIDHPKCSIYNKIFHITYKVIYILIFIIK